LVEFRRLIIVIKQWANKTKATHKLRGLALKIDLISTPFQHPISVPYFSTLEIGSWLGATAFYGGIAQDKGIITNFAKKASGETVIGNGQFGE
jgi:hypothetical protein